ncbi:MAG: hypothetical protein OEY87_06975 [Gammaproteobacteria bacterium]|nr:hypothetical protein [Gammaproteobacteria bacterium]MDH5735848.1 hypothetical protein [Gammaproteobacteria bacterium]
MNKNIHTIKTACNKHFTFVNAYTKNAIIPQTKICLYWLLTFIRQTLFPHTRTTLQLARNELIKIHQKQHWYKRCSKTMFENSVGLAMAMLSTKIIQHFVEIREFSNLWGLFATRPVVSEATYETLSFLIEFLIALIVFTISGHFFEEYRDRNNAQQ